MKKTDAPPDTRDPPARSVTPEDDCPECGGVSAHMPTCTWPKALATTPELNASSDPPAGGDAPNRALESVRRNYYSTTDDEWALSEESMQWLVRQITKGVLESQAATIATLRQEVEALKPDAERYRAYIRGRS